MPTPPDPLTALFEILLLLFPNHLYPGISILSSPRRKVSQMQIMSKLVACMIFSLSLQWSLLVKPLTFHAPQLTLLRGGDEMAGPRVDVSGTLSAVPGFESYAKGALPNQGDGRGSGTLAGEVGDTVQAMACGWVGRWQ